MADTNVKLLFGTETNFTTDGKKPANTKGSVYFTTVDTARGYLYFGDGTNFLNIVPKLLGVPNGGTGRATLDSGKALIGNGTGAVNLRSITNNTSVNRIAASTNLITANTLAFWNGAYDTNGNSRIASVGTIKYGTWEASTVAVGYGGTGKKTFTVNSLLYGNTNNALQETNVGTDGQVLASVAGVPTFVTPTISWDEGGSAGPTLRFVISDEAYTAVIPSATKDNSGIVTTAEQYFAGVKRFTNDIIASNIRPSAINTYSLGSATLPWHTTHTRQLQIRNSKAGCVGQFYSQTLGTTSAQGIATLEIGNNKNATTADNARGYLDIFGTSTTKTRIQTESSSSDKTVTIPNYTGYMVIGTNSVVNPTSATTYYLPFYQTQYKRLGCNDGFRLTSLEGTDSALGYSQLVLGNNTKQNTAKNKYGLIKFYGRDAESYTLTTPTSTTTETGTNIVDYTLYLPTPSATTGTAELLYHDVGTSIGSTSRPVYIGTNGKPALVTKIAVSYGGTGAQTFTSNGILYGAGTDAIKATAAGTQGQILSVNSSGTPGFGSPSWSWANGGASGPTLTLTIQDKAWTTAAIPSASGSVSGIVTTGTQTFAGIKTFSNTTASTSYTTGAVKISGGLGVAGNVYSNSNVVATGYGSFGGDVYAKGGEVYIGPDGGRATLSYDGNTDTLTISFT